MAQKHMATVKCGDIFTYAGCWAVVRAVARDGSWASIRLAPRLLSTPREQGRWPLPLPPSFRPASEGTAPMPSLAHIPDEYLDAYAALSREREGRSASAVFAERMEATRQLHDLEVRHDWNFRPDADDAAEEWVRRREARVRAAPARRP